MPDSPIEYRIDADDRISYVSPTWDAFADANNGAAARGEAILGRPVWDFISDVSTREIYKQALARIRSGNDFNFTFRCDSPDCRRLLEMTMTLHGPDGSVAFRTKQVSEAPRALDFTAQGDGAAEPELLRVCGWCNKVDVSGNWLELEEALPRLRLWEYPDPRMITHGICDACMSTMMAEVDALR